MLTLAENLVVCFTEKADPDGGDKIVKGDLIDAIAVTWGDDALLALLQKHKGTVRGREIDKKVWGALNNGCATIGGWAWKNSGRPARKDEHSNDPSPYVQSSRWRLYDGQGEALVAVQGGDAQQGRAREAIRVAFMSAGGSYLNGPYPDGLAWRMEVGGEWQGRLPLLWLHPDVSKVSAGAESTSSPTVPLAFKTFFNRSESKQLIVLYGVGAGEVIVCEKTGPSKLTIGTVKKQHESTRLDKLGDAWVAGKATNQDLTGIGSIHQSFTSCKVGGDGDDRDTVVMARITHQAVIELDGLVDSTWDFDADYHVTRHASTAQVEITVQLRSETAPAPPKHATNPSAGGPLTSDGEP